MKPLLAVALLALALGGCQHSSGPLAEIPDELLTCQGAPAWRRGGSQRNVAVHVTDLRGAHEDCYGKLGAVRAIARPGQ
ncbi:MULTISPECIES: hypothetical protein [Methylobacterium]|uniref:Lipoprotein n=1 Tax=Methylobacterium radiotolerans (strain ATCC 27329 / DSM 1819 / JCM 2831 / NBRC 15690 / NCIMB 10815 / 0-1) TaxID=426355 RepID=B1M181_METRJ|nr:MULTISPECIES: hypothetical protein [Methylobacterium]ACB24631.1 hypothetical protein Mrad2831_2647 [Methylobacterium radiotolerans JCM 2831]MBE7248536.1 hypothetical protein [Actinomycetospora chiangmaiensis]GEM97096.1 hypothetical protein MRA01_16360 [Methylobacterium radiotolerans]